MSTASPEVASVGGQVPTEPSRPEPALVVSGLTTGYDRTTVLRDVSLTVPAGEVTALVGPNGAGKSTLLRAVCGFLPASRGTVTLLGRDVTTLATHRRFAAGLCHVPEGRGVFRSLSVRENLRMQAPRGQEAAAVDRAVGAFPVLGRRLAQTAGTLSGGEQQMLALVSAYVRDPRLVLVDEASLGLAPKVVDEVFVFLATLPAAGAALLVVDQFVTRALELATTAYVMRRGQIAYFGPAAALSDADLFQHYAGS
ncbi:MULTISPECIES: ABC transporter ATP-binding protein [unclassified Pseudofrankia]|uniref:ABC transporter ATP-binding protein n=1 Tax=unclassified Pseudofrankia TaxID=2994372 RepID=UPI000ADC0B9B|nr:MULTISPECIES: ABC transporter ATP-binding protein [unclassified Pseudofrankia]MDT3439847.1 ABC transporter ATP-binding protein [Pseudofrankia sp. BMG5.37]